MVETDIRTIIREELAAFSSPWLDTAHAEAYAAGSRDNLMNLRKNHGLRRYGDGKPYKYKKSDIDRAIEETGHHTN
jgi:hypothetical protein